MSEEKKIVKTSEINFKVHLAEDKIPETIEWSATDSPIENAQDAKAIALAIWDGNRKESFRIDLWTRTMSIEEMNHFFFQTIATMSDSYLRATNNQDGHAILKEMAEKFGKSTEVLKA